MAVFRERLEIYFCERLENISECRPFISHNAFKLVLFYAQHIEQIGDILFYRCLSVCLHKLNVKT